MYETWDFHTQLREKSTVFSLLESKLIQPSQIKSMHIQEYILLPNIYMTNKFLHRAIRRYGDDHGNLAMVTETWKQHGNLSLEEGIMKCNGHTRQGTLENQIATFSFVH